MLRTAGKPNFHITISSTANAAEPQMISFLSGSNGDGACWQSLTSLPDRNNASQCWSVGELKWGFAAVPAANVGRGDEQHRDHDAGYCDERTDASTHRSSCPGFSP